MSPISSRRLRKREICPLTHDNTTNSGTNSLNIRSLKGKPVSRKSSVPTALLSTAPILSATLAQPVINAEMGRLALLGRIIRDGYCRDPEQGAINAEQINVDTKAHSLTHLSHFHNNNQPSPPATQIYLHNTAFPFSSLARHLPLSG